MKVSIEHDEWKRGLIFKVTHYCVNLKVELSEEEKKIIKDRNLEHVIISDQRGNTLLSKDPDFENNITFSSLQYGTHIRGFATISDAKLFEQHLIEQLKQAKVFLDQNAGIEQKSRSFEL